MSQVRKEAIMNKMGIGMRMMLAGAALAVVVMIVILFSLGVALVTQVPVLGITFITLSLIVGLVFAGMLIETVRG